MTTMTIPTALTADSETSRESFLELGSLYDDLACHCVSPVERRRAVR